MIPTIRMRPALAVLAGLVMRRAVAPRGGA